MDTVVSVSAEKKGFFRFRPKRKMAVSAIFGFGRNEKKRFGCTLLFWFQMDLKICLQVLQIFIFFYNVFLGLDDH